MTSAIDEMDAEGKIRASLASDEQQNAIDAAEDYFSVQ
jgi:hypothetical protein